MKIYYVLFAIIIVLSFKSCTDVIIEPDQESPLIYLEGKIENFELGDNIILRMDLDYRIGPTGVDSIVVIDSTIVESDGSFNFMINTPPDGFLRPRNGLACAELTFSNEEIRTYPHHTFRLYKYNERVGGIRCAYLPYDGEYHVGGYTAYVMYSEDNLLVKGDCVGISGNRQNISRYNLELVKGWNMVIHTIIENSDSALVSERIVDNDFIGQWILLD